MYVHIYTRNPFLAAINHVLKFVMPHLTGLEDTGHGTQRTRNNPSRSQSRLHWYDHKHKMYMYIDINKRKTLREITEILVQQIRIHPWTPIRPHSAQMSWQLFALFRWFYMTQIYAQMQIEPESDLNRCQQKKMAKWRDYFSCCIRWVTKTDALEK